jgi:hypothetical protein
MPFDPSSVVAEYVDVLRRYGIREAQADRYAAEWVVSAFAEPGRDITITPSERSKSEIFLEAEVLFAQGSIAIPNDRILLQELRSLERRTHRGRAIRSIIRSTARTILRTRVMARP